MGGLLEDFKIARDQTLQAFYIDVNGKFCIERNITDKYFTNINAAEKLLYEHLINKKKFRRSCAEGINVKDLNTKLKDFSINASSFFKLKTHSEYPEKKWLKDSLPSRSFFQKSDWLKQLRIKAGAAKLETASPVRSSRPVF